MKNDERVTLTINHHPRLFIPDQPSPRSPRVYDAPHRDRRHHRNPSDRCRSRGGCHLRVHGQGAQNAVEGLRRALDLVLFEVTHYDRIGKDRPRFLDDLLLAVPAGDVG